MKTITGLYSISDWAELFSLCASAAEFSTNLAPERGSQTWIDVHDWLCEYSKAHDFPPPEETDSWSDTEHVIKESIMFLEKFAENHHDDFQHRKDAQDLRLEQNK